MSPAREFGLLCPVCEGHHLRVYDVRSVAGELRRWRECLDCGSRFRTIETVAKIIRNTRAAPAPVTPADRMRRHARRAKNEKGYKTLPNMTRNALAKFLRRHATNVSVPSSILARLDQLDRMNP